MENIRSGPRFPFPDANGDCDNAFATADSATLRPWQEMAPDASTRELLDLSPDRARRVLRGSQEDIDFARLDEAEKIGRLLARQRAT